MASMLRAADDPSPLDAPAAALPADVPLGEAAPSLVAALRRARAEEAERSAIVHDLRATALARLEMLKAALEPVFAQIPKGFDLFDLGVLPAERPRLFVDMVAFIELARDQKRFVFVQDTQDGRVVLAESERIEPMRAAVTDYIARRIVAREKALAASVSGGMSAAMPAPAAMASPAPISVLAVPEKRGGTIGRMLASLFWLVLGGGIGAALTFAYAVWRVRGG